MTLIILLARQWDKVLGLNLNDLLVSYDLLFNLGWNTSRETKNDFVEVLE